MRRKSTRSSAKASPEKTKEEKPPKKTRRTRRQKRSSSDSDSDDDVPVAQTIEQHHSEDSKGFDDDRNSETQKAKSRTPERASKRLRKKSVTLPEEDEEKTTRRSRRRGGTPKLEDIDEEDVEGKRAKGKSKGKNKSKIDQTSQISETEIPSDNSENAQVTAQSPHIDNVANNDDADNVGVNQMDDGSEKDKKCDNNVEMAETGLGADVKPSNSVDDSTNKESSINAANADEGSTTNESSSVTKIEESSTAIESKAESIAESSEKKVETEYTDGTESNENLVETQTNICENNTETVDKLETDVEKKDPPEKEGMNTEPVDDHQDKDPTPVVKKSDENSSVDTKNECVVDEVMELQLSTPAGSVENVEKTTEKESKNEEIAAKSGDEKVSENKEIENSEIAAESEIEEVSENVKIAVKSNVEEVSANVEIVAKSKDDNEEIAAKFKDDNEEIAEKSNGGLSEKCEAGEIFEKSEAKEEVCKKSKSEEDSEKSNAEVHEKLKAEESETMAVSNKRHEEVSERTVAKEEVSDSRNNETSAHREKEKVSEADESLNKLKKEDLEVTITNKDTEELAGIKPDSKKAEIDVNNSNTVVRNKVVVEDEKMEVDEEDFTKPDDSNEIKKVAQEDQEKSLQKSAAYNTLLEEIIQKNKNERPIPERRKINIKARKRKNDHSDGQGDASSSAAKDWDFKLNLTPITSDVFISMYPELSLLNEVEVKLERKERRPTVSEYERKVEDRVSESREVKESEATVENIIAMNRKISIVDDDASKLKPPPSPAKNDRSAVLYITNLVRPFTIKQLRELLERTGNLKEEGFWTDRIKSKCYVQYQTVEEAEATRNALHGVHWPICNGKKLIIDYSTIEDLEMAKNPPPVVPVAPAVPEKENQEPDIAPLKKGHKDELDLEKEAKLKVNNSWEMDSVKEEAAHVRRSRSKDRMDKRRFSRSRHSRSSSEADYGKKKQKKIEEAVPQRAMDDLFRKTEATPCIYWQPLSPEEIALKQQQRLERMAEHKRRMETQTRNKRGPEHSRGGPYRRRY